MPKADKLETDKRIEAARVSILRGDSAFTICRNMSLAFNVSSRQVERYIARAREELKAVTDLERVVMMSEHVSVRRYLRAEAIKAGDYRTALASAVDEAKLFDLYPANKNEISGANGSPIMVVIDK